MYLPSKRACVDLSLSCPDILTLLKPSTLYSAHRGTMLALQKCAPIEELKSITALGLIVVPRPSHGLHWVADCTLYESLSYGDRSYVHACYIHPCFGSERHVYQSTLGQIVVVIFFL